MQKEAIALQNMLLDSDNKEMVLQHSEEGLNATVCIGDTFGADHVMSYSMDSVVVNTKVRSDAYLRATDLLAGTTTPLSKTPCEE